MAPAASQSGPPPAADPAAVRVVLFGMPDAGKSSLLGALAQAAQSQERALGGRLIDLTSGLAELQRRVYDDRPRETTDEIVPYPVAIDPLAGSRPDAEHRESAVLVDCDGRVANDLLTRRRAAAGDPPPNSLAAAVEGADALVLVVDAGATPAQVDADLAEFVRFLRLFRRRRGERTEVGGLPVYLVLSKCDLLAKPDDTAAAWQARVEAREAEVGRRFREFLEADADEDAVPFGDVDLEVMATAVKWPALAGSPARPREPWGVAELFHKALAAARTFHARRRLSQRRLTWTVIGSVVVLAGFAAFAGGVMLNRPSFQRSELAAKVESYRAREGQTPSVRLTEPLQRKIGELTDLENDPGFAALPPETQDYVRSHLAELEAYRGYKEGLAAIRSPAEARSIDDLAAVERALKEEQPPAQYQAEWRQTDAAQQRDKWLDDVKALRKAAGDVEDWYRQLTAKGNRLLLFGDRPAETAPLPWVQWLDGVEALSREAASPPFRRGDRVRESRSAAGAAPVTYTTVFNFPSVNLAREAWDKVRQRLDRLRDQAQALGLGGDGNRPAVLRLTERFSADQAGDVLAALRQTYAKPNEWSLADLPDAAAPEIRRAAQASYQRAILAGREVVRRRYLEQYSDGKETPQRWRAMADWLAAAAELHDWREVANLLLRLSDPAGEDPVTALAAFLRRDQFEIELRSVRLTIPDDLRDSRLRPAGRLTITAQSESGTNKLNFRVDGEGTRDARRRTTTFALVLEGTTGLSVRPGDNVSAEVPARDANGRNWTLSWTASVRSPLYQVERLALPPRLHRGDQKAEAGERAEGVTLTPVPDRGLPRVPDLLPPLN